MRYLHRNQQVRLGTENPQMESPVTERTEWTESFSYDEHITMTKWGRNLFSGSTGSVS